MKLYDVGYEVSYDDIDDGVVEASCFEALAFGP